MFFLERKLVSSHSSVSVLASAQVKILIRTFLATTMVGLSIGVLLAISSSILFILRGSASFWLGDNANLAAAQRTAATPYTQAWAQEEETWGKSSLLDRIQVFQTDEPSQLRSRVPDTQVRDRSRPGFLHRGNLQEVTHAYKNTAWLGLIGHVTRFKRTKKVLMKLNLPMFLGFRKSTSPSQFTYTVSRQK